MLAALRLEQLIKKLPQVTRQDLIDFYRDTYKEAFTEGQKDARLVCGCLGEEEE